MPSPASAGLVGVRGMDSRSDSDSRLKRLGYRCWKWGRRPTSTSRGLSLFGFLSPPLSFENDNPYHAYHSEKQTRPNGVESPISNSVLQRSGDFRGNHPRDTTEGAIGCYGCGGTTGVGVYNICERAAVEKPVRSVCKNEVRLPTDGGLTKQKILI
jgi:hypothetical protein